MDYRDLKQAYKNRAYIDFLQYVNFFERIESDMSLESEAERCMSMEEFEEKEAHKFDYTPDGDVI